MRAGAAHTFGDWDFFVLGPAVVPIAYHMIGILGQKVVEVVKAIPDRAHVCVLVEERAWCC